MIQPQRDADDLLELHVSIHTSTCSSEGVHAVVRFYKGSVKNVWASSFRGFLDEEKIHWNVLSFVTYTEPFSYPACG